MKTKCLHMTQIKEEPMHNYEAKNVKWGGEKLRIQKHQSTKRFMKLIWKIHEVAKGKGPLS